MFFHPNQFPSSLHTDISQSLVYPFSKNQGFIMVNSSRFSNGGFLRILSDQILISFPLLYTQVNFVWINDVASLHNFKIGEPCFSTKGESRNLLQDPLKYFFIKIVFHHSCDPVTRCHKILAHISILIKVGSFIVSPPLSSNPNSKSINKMEFL